DAITVGHGNDAFVFNETATNAIGSVTVSGFNPSHDVFDFTSAVAAAVGLTGNQAAMDSQLAALFHDSGPGGAAQIHLDATDTLTLTGVHSAALHASDFYIV
ncbi:MAG TPA: hypothetical protein VMT22_21095, partial [Terriglobales bacterium]|nr:hypothetical protein [Terriglobales bacterium]